MRRKNTGLEAWVYVVIAVFSAVYLMLTRFQGKLPDDEPQWTEETDMRTGEHLKVQIIKCQTCNQVVSYLRFHLNGKVLDGRASSVHRCKPSDIAKSKFDSLGPQPFDLLDFLAKWQKRLSEGLCEKRK